LVDQIGGSTMSPRLSDTKPDPDKIYMAWQSAAVFSLPDNPVVKHGQRLPGSHPIVQAVPWLFVEDGDEQAAAEKLAEDLRAHAPVEAAKLPPAPPIRDEDAVVAISDYCASKGSRRAKSDDLVKDNPSHFEPVVPRGLKREDAVVALADFEREDNGKVRKVFAGQWIHHEDELVQMHPESFATPSFSFGRTA
jgi:hypothetical protein